MANHRSTNIRRRETCLSICTFKVSSLGCSHPIPFKQCHTYYLHIRRTDFRSRGSIPTPSPPTSPTSPPPFSNLALALQLQPRSTSPRPLQLPPDWPSARTQPPPPHTGPVPPRHKRPFPPTTPSNHIVSSPQYSQRALRARANGLPAFQELEREGLAVEVMFGVYVD